VWTTLNRCFLPPHPRLCGLALAVFVFGAQRPLDSVRWWRSARVSSAIELTAAQVAEIDAFYAASLPARDRLAEAMVAAMTRVARLNDDNAANDELLAATQELSMIAAQQRTIDVALRVRAFRVLSVRQRGSLSAVPRVASELIVAR
jgi:hypothetical protein